MGYSPRGHKKSDTAEYAHSRRGMDLRETREKALTEPQAFLLRLVQIPLAKSCPLLRGSGTLHSPFPTCIKVPRVSCLVSD